MAGMRRVSGSCVLAAALVALASCTSPLLDRIRDEVARYPFTATSYQFSFQVGTDRPEHVFNRPLVRADTAGNVYVADGSFRIRKFTAAGVLQQTLSCVSLRGPSAYLADMAFDTAGNIYVVTNNVVQVQKYSPAGALVAEWGGTTSYGGLTLANPDAIAVSPSGIVYVADSSNYRIVCFDTDGNYLSNFGTYDSAGDGGSPGDGGQFRWPAAVEVDVSGSIYVLDHDTGFVQKFSPAHAWASQWGGPALYGTANLALSGPLGLTVSPGATQYVYVTDTGNDRCLKFSTTGAPQAGFDWGTTGTLDGEFTGPFSITVDSSGLIYVADDNPANDWGDRVQKFNGSASPVTWLASWGATGQSGAGLLAAPYGVAFDAADNLLVVDAVNCRVSKYGRGGAFVASWCSPGPGPGELDFPLGIALDDAGRMLIIELSNNRFTVLDASGAFLRTVGSPGSADGYFANPSAIAVDPEGFISVADFNNDRVQVFTSGYNWARTFGSVGSGDGKFSHLGIYGIAADSAGNIYVSDLNENRVQKFDRQGTFLLKWGTLGTGPGEFNAPAGIAVDRVGNVFVADLGNRRVQKFDSTGRFLAAFGVPGAGHGAFAWPSGVAVDSRGRVAVSDFSGALVQVFDPLP